MSVTLKRVWLVNSAKRIHYLPVFVQPLLSSGIFHIPGVFLISLFLWQSVGKMAGSTFLIFSLGKKIGVGRRKCFIENVNETELKLRAQWDCFMAP